VSEKEMSLASENTRLTQQGQLLVDKAKIISNSFDPVKVIAELIEYNRLLTKLYQKNMRVK